MKVCAIDLKENYPFLQGGKLECLFMDRPFHVEREWKRPAVIVVPGGGYWHVSPSEGDPIASAFIALGFHTFVLKYLCAPEGVHYPEQLLEIAAAADYIRKHAEEYNVNGKEIFVVGFSAGGHLAANLSVSYDLASKLAGVSLDCKPTAVGLSYPVIAYNYGHTDSFNNLLQGYSEEERKELLPQVNLDTLVTADTPPTFIWCTAEDIIVPPENTIRHTLALMKAGVQYESHIYPKGPHGLSTSSVEIWPFAEDIPKVASWIKDCADFFRMYAEEKV
ncbi:MAG: alpha/beta hydrolase [Clostridiales bacterium]|nr:alpha/beta hydrolase [Clostridiales bacterium]